MHTYSTTPHPPSPPYPKAKDSHHDYLGGLPRGIVISLYTVMYMGTIDYRPRHHQGGMGTCAVIGKPRSEELTTSEIEVFQRCGVEMPTTTKVLVYQQMIVANKTVSVGMKRRTLRDNSGFVYSSGGTQHFAILKKIVSHGDEYALAFALSPATHQLCSDDTTNAGLNDHLTTFNPPM